VINIFFVPGMFGSTIEFCIANFTYDYQSKLRSPESYIQDDGSLHSFSKQFHPTSTDLYKQLASADIDVTTINTPIYPTTDRHFPELLELLKDNETFSKNKNILLYAKDFSSAELNMFFQYEKIAVGLKLGLDIFFYSNDSLKQWNSKYSHWSELETWELREWFSIFYPDWLQEWIDSKNSIGDSFLSISNTDFLYNTKHELYKIFDHCGLTPQQNNIDNFIKMWHNKQKYIIKQQEFCNHVANNTINNKYQSWHKINFIQEAVIQKNLRDKGYEMRCWNLNQFPSNTEQLHNLLEKV
jgi:hypothetical protein